MQSLKLKRFLNFTGMLLAFAICSLCLNATGQDEFGELQYLEVKVLDTEGKPKADINVEISIDGASFPMMSDEEGIVPLNIPGEGARLYISIQEEGYVSLGARWYKGDKIPEEFTIPLQKGTTIGGVVHDEQGNPVEGVEIEATVSSNSSDRGKLRPYYNGPIATTDSQGRWKTETAPDKSMNIYLRFNHEDYIKPNPYGVQGAAWDLLKSLEHVFVVKRGIDITGTITNAGSKPLAGAKVAVGTSRFGGENFQTTETDEGGRYQFKNVNAGPSAITVYAENWSPDFRPIVIAKGMEPVDFQLELGYSIRVKVTDPDGNPISGVWLAPDTWRANRSIGGVMPKPVTDDAGIWESNSVPEDFIDYDILKQGRMSVRDQQLAPQEEMHVIVMPDPLKVSGTVTDSETGKPIEEFSIIEGTQWNAQRSNVDWRRYNTHIGNNGKYEVEFDEQYFGHLVRIEVSGYKPGISRLIKSDEGEATFDFQLEVGVGPSGIVKTPDGKLAEGAQVGLSTVNQSIAVPNGQLQQYSDAPITITDNKGRFNLPFPDSECLIVLVHDTGWKQLTLEQLEELSDITLEPWAQLRGKAFKGKEPMPHEKIHLNQHQSYEQDRPRVHWSSNTITDKDGTFKFDHIKPGTVQVCRAVAIGGTGNGPRMSMFTHSEQVEVLPNEVAQVQIGGVGRKIQGQFVVPDEYTGEVSWLMSHVNLHGQRTNPSSGNPVQALGKTLAQLGQANKSQKPARLKIYAAAIDVDGNFEIYDVEPGQYSMNVQLLAPPEDNRYSYNPVATLNEMITIPEGEEPYDLGKKTLALVKPVPANGEQVEFILTPAAPAPAE